MQVAYYGDLGFEQRGSYFSQGRDHPLWVGGAKAINHVSFHESLGQHVGAQGWADPRQIPFRIGFDVGIDRRVEQKRGAAAVSPDFAHRVAGILVDRLI